MNENEIKQFIFAHENDENTYAITYFLKNQVSVGNGGVVNKKSKGRKIILEGSDRWEHARYIIEVILGLHSDRARKKTMSCYIVGYTLNEFHNKHGDIKAMKKISSQEFLDHNGEIVICRFPCQDDNVPRYIPKKYKNREEETANQLEELEKNIRTRLELPWNPRFPATNQGEDDEDEDEYYTDEDEKREKWEQMTEDERLEHIANVAASQNGLSEEDRKKLIEEDNLKQQQKRRSYRKLYAHQRCHPSEAKELREKNPPPPHYICHCCRVQGHWIADCPKKKDSNFKPLGQFRAPSGIPKTFLKPATEDDRDKAFMTHEGEMFIYNDKKIQENEQRFSTRKDSRSSGSVSILSSSQYNNDRNPIELGGNNNARDRGPSGSTYSRGRNHNSRKRKNNRHEGSRGEKRCRDQ